MRIESGWASGWLVGSGFGGERSPGFLRSPASNLFLIEHPSILTADDFAPAAISGRRLLTGWCTLCGHTVEDALTCHCEGVEQRLRRSELFSVLIDRYEMNP
jgi:hypothetical protein